MVTSIYTGLSALLFIRLSIAVIKYRRVLKHPYGVTKDRCFQATVAAHSNFAQYAPLALFLLYLLENSQIISVFLLHSLGFLLFLGRVLHYYGLVYGEKHGDFVLRKMGMHLTLWPILVMAVLCLLHPIWSGFFI